MWFVSRDYCYCFHSLHSFYVYSIEKLTSVNCLINCQVNRCCRHLRSLISKKKDSIEKIETTKKMEGTNNTSAQIIYMISVFFVLFGFVALMILFSLNNFLLWYSNFKRLEIKSGDTQTRYIRFCNYPWVDISASCLLLP